MINPEHFFEQQIQPRWPDWEPTGPQITDWEDMIRPYSESVVLKAVKDHNYSRAGSYKTPKPSEVRMLLNKCRADSPLYKREFCVQKEGTNNFILFTALEHAPITDEQLTDAAVNKAQDVAALYGGRWIAHAGMTGEQMVEKRNEAAKAIM